MISLVKPDDRPIFRTVDVFEIYSRAHLYTAYFEDSKIPEKIRDEFFMGCTNILKILYKSCNINHPLEDTLNHPLEDIHSEEIKNCECYKLVSKLLKEAKYLIRKDGEKVVLNDNKG